MFASGWLPTIRGEGNLVLARWEAAGAHGLAVDVQCRIEHGLIAAQWFGVPGPELATSSLPTARGELTLTTLTRGSVDPEAVAYASQRLLHLATAVAEPILFARVKLSMAADPARARPAMAQVSFDVNGRIVRAHVAAHTMHEAVDLLERRIADKIEHESQRREALRRHRPGVATAGEWRHGDLPTIRPEYFDRPTEERELVRHKAFVAREQSVDEATFDMDQLDYDFHLFRDIGSGEDSVLERLPNDGYRLQHLHPVDHATATAAGVAVDETPVPTLEVREGIERLDAGGESFVFFANAATGRGTVVYRRYDGHYGLITLEETPAPRS